jgi:hypothetical protein
MLSLNLLVEDAIGTEYDLRDCKADKHQKSMYLLPWKINKSNISLNFIPLAFCFSSLQIQVYGTVRSISKVIASDVTMPNSLKFLVPSNSAITYVKLIRITQQFQNALQLKLLTQILFLCRTAEEYLVAETVPKLSSDPKLYALHSRKTETEMQQELNGRPNARTSASRYKPKRYSEDLDTPRKT